MADEKSGIRGRGKRGHRGHRGKRGHRGHHGTTGATGSGGGATGATGATGTDGSGAFFAMASIVDSEGPILVAGLNVVPLTNADYDGTTLTLTLVVGVPDIGRVAISALLKGTSNPPDTITATMGSTTTILVRAVDATPSPFLPSCYVTLALIP